MTVGPCFVFGTLLCHFVCEGGGEDGGMWRIRGLVLGAVEPWKLYSESGMRAGLGGVK